MIEHDQTLKTFSTIVDGYKAFINYEIVQGRVDVLTTQVPHAISGRGIAATLMDACSAFVKENNLEFADEITCSYAKAYLEKHYNQG